MAQRRTGAPAVDMEQTDSARQVSLYVSIPVQIVDISLSGVLLASTLQLAVGNRVELKIELGSHSMSRLIEVRRVSMSHMSARAGAYYYAAAVFLPSTPEQRAMLEETLRSE